MHGAVPVPGSGTRTVRTRYVRLAAPAPKPVPILKLLQTVPGMLKHAPMLENGQKQNFAARTASTLEILPEAQIFAEVQPESVHIGLSP